MASTPEQAVNQAINLISEELNLTEDQEDELFELLINKIDGYLEEQKELQ